MYQSQLGPGVPKRKKEKKSIAFLYRKLTFIIIILALFEDLSLCQLKNTAIPLKPIDFLIKKQANFVPASTGISIYG